MRYRPPWRDPYCYLPVAVAAFGLLQSPERATPVVLWTLAALLVVYVVALGTNHIAYLKRMRALDDFYRRTLGREPPRHDETGG